MPHTRLRDEQALLAKVRYNRLVDIFLGITTYSLQNHLRTTVKRYGAQIEIDEVYVGVNRNGQQFVVARSGQGRDGQLERHTNDVRTSPAAKRKFPNLTCRPVSAQFMAGRRDRHVRADADGEDVKVVEERHYRLVPSDQIGDRGSQTLRKTVKLKQSRMDHVSKEVRSKIMAAVHSRGNTTTELPLAKLLWAAGLKGYRKHWPVAESRISRGPAGRWRYSLTAVSGTAAAANTCPALIQSSGATRSKRTSAVTGA